MRAVFSIVLTLSLGAAACGPQVQILLVRGEDLEAAPEFVRFEFADFTAKEVERFGPYAVSGLPGEELARVPPDHEFAIHVIGCKTADEAECLDPDDFLAQGCSPRSSLGRGEPATFEIALHSAATGAAKCGILDIRE